MRIFACGGHQQVAGSKERPNLQLGAEGTPHRWAWRGVAHSPTARRVPCGRSTGLPGRRDDHFALDSAPSSCMSPVCMPAITTPHFPHPPFSPSPLPSLDPLLSPPRHTLARSKLGMQAEHEDDVAWTRQAHRRVEHDQLYGHALFGSSTCTSRAPWLQ